MTAGGQHVQWLPLGIVALLALLSGWLDQLATAPLVVDNAGFAHEPDYSVERFEAQAFDDHGRPLHLLKAERMTHYMDDDTTELIQPRLRMSSDGRAPLEVRARRGLIFGQGEAVHFLGDVHAVRQGAPADLTLDAEHLRVVPDAGRYTSDKPVVFRQGQSVIRAGGLFADDQHKLLQLTGGVRGLYEKTR